MSNENTNNYKETIVDLGTIDLNHPPPSPKERKHHHHHARNGTKEAVDNRSEKVHERVASLTGPEAFFLKALLVDDKKEAENEETEKLLKSAAPAKLSDEMLFSVPKQIPDSPPKSTKPIPKPMRRSNHGLWLAHADGVPSKKLISLRGLLNRIHPGNGSTDEPFQRSTSSSSGGGGCVKGERPPRPPISPASRNNSRTFQQGFALRERCSTTDSTSSTESADDGVLSDEEVRPENGGEDESWDSQLDANHREYDAWEVLKDEYASDFGFNYTAPGSNRADDDVPPDSFQILGTNADDKESQPHVLSPPLMDALAAFLPEPLLGQNWWLRFSLVRDGANLDTLKRYVRASTYTILAIETPSGEVFGSFTSSPWRTAYGFYGKAPAFVWKMRHSRQTKCSSLFDQAQLESEIDVFMAAEGGYHRERVQLCRHDAIGVGGDEDLPTIEDYDTIQDALQAAKNVGFAICLEDDLLRGTTSHCSTFHNPALCGSGSRSQVFDVAGLEVWTLTPCFNVEAAEKLEMTKFFLEEQSTRSIRSGSSNFPDSPQLSNRNSFAGSDYNQESFYRRVGHDPDSEIRRDRWQYLNTMGGGTAGDTRGLGATPRFT